MTPEQKMLEQFMTEMAQSREQSRNNDIANKIMNGEELSLEEEQYLAKNNPGQLSNYRRVKAERKEYEEKLEKCKTKDEVQRLKTNTMNAYLAELKAAPGEAKAAKAMEILGKVRNVIKAELHFIKSGGYAKLPTESEESIDKAKERSEENEDKSIENLVTDTHKKRHKVKKKEKDSLEEIESICGRYIPSIPKDTENSSASKPRKENKNTLKSGSYTKIDFSI